MSNALKRIPTLKCYKKDSLFQTDGDKIESFLKVIPGDVISDTLFSESGELM